MGYDESTDYGGPEPTRRVFVLGVLIFAIAVVLILAYARAGEFVGAVDNVPDGDTLWVCDATACHKIRLCGVNAPEAGATGYREGKDALKALVIGKTVRGVQVGNGTPCDGKSKPTNRDRIVAQCFAGEVDLAGELVASGAACDWIKFSGGQYARDGKGRSCP